MGSGWKWIYLAVIPLIYSCLRTFTLVCSLLKAACHKKLPGKVLVPSGVQPLPGQR
jgi:hypothetical protein